MSAKPRLFRWVYARRLVATVFVLLLLFGRFDWFPWFKGATTATLVAHWIPLVDPLAGADVLLASRQIDTALVMGMVILLAFAVLYGPVFCGWVCPLGLVLDINQSLRRFLMRGTRVRRIPVSSSSAQWRYAILGITLGLTITLRLPIFQTVSPINLLAWAIVHGAFAGIIVVGALALLEWAFPRFWCRVVCPLGALYSLVGRWGLLRVRINPTEAGKTPCRQCTLHCPMGVRVMEDYSLAHRLSVDHPECTRCGDCVDACPRPVLRLGIKRCHQWYIQGTKSHHDCELMDVMETETGDGASAISQESGLVQLKLQVPKSRTIHKPLDKGDVPGL